MIKLSVIQQRTCGECTKCCEGWLNATIKGHPMHKGRPCFFLDKGRTGCTEYMSRPQDPCIDYSCAWLQDSNTFPIWLKPDVSNVLITSREVTKDGKVFPYYDIIEAGSKMDAEILNWLIHWILMSGVNSRYEVSGNKFVFGDPYFSEAITDARC